MYFNNNNQNLKPLRKQLRREQTEAERKLWNLLRGRQLMNLKFVRQYGFGNYILDLYCSEKKLAIELDGGQHAEMENMRSDDARTEYLNKNGIKVLRFWNNDVLNNIEGVGEAIMNEVVSR